MDRRRGFALMVTIYLVALMAAGGAALAFTAMTESTLARWSAKELDHRLLLESTLTCLPHLLASDSGSAVVKGAKAAGRRFELELLGHRVVFHLRAESKKLAVGSQPQDSQLRRRLSEIARANGLPEANVRLKPVRGTELPGAQKYFWFDQVIGVGEFEEVFRWRLPAGEEVGADMRRTWSDLIGFWGAASGGVYAMDAATTVGSQTRRWFVVVRVAGGEAVVLSLQPI